MDQQQRIRERAHCLWEEVGRPTGRQQEHWQRACGEIDAENHRGDSQSRNSDPGTPAASRLNAGLQSNDTGSSGLVGSDDIGVGTPDAMAVDDLKVAGSLDDPRGAWPSTGRSKLVGT